VYVELQSVSQGYIVWLQTVRIAYTLLGGGVSDGE
jgi:hypothetical protein